MTSTSTTQANLLSDWRSLPLAEAGRCLIEASAGTGKTWTIAMLYLRLLLECGNDPRQIVVTTFTIAAAQELRERIRARLLRATALAERRIADAEGRIDMDALADAGDRWLAVRWSGVASMVRADLNRLRLAQAELDIAPITTLHGLCRKILADHPFESGSAFDLGEQIASDVIDGELRNDLWRRLAQSDAGMDDGDRAWFASGRKALDGALKLALAPGVSIREIDSAEIDAMMLPENAAAIRDFIGDGAHFARSNSKLKAQLEVLADFIATGNALAPIPDRLKEPLAGPLESHFKPVALAQARADPVLSFARRALELLAHADAPAKASALIRYRADLLAQREQRLHERGLLTFDAIIARAHDALHGDAGRMLADSLFAEWPVALVDEFQDTDARQYAIVDRIHRDDADAPRGQLVMIGDPKQAIYRFRGGDIHAYLAAKRSATSRLDLHTNYRSSSGLIGACNDLFRLAGTNLSQSGSTGIAYEPIDGGTKVDQTPLTEAGLPCLRPLTFHVSADNAGNKEARRDAALVACANRIAGMLQSRAFRIGDEELKPGDLAVLLPKNDDIARLRSLLAARGVPCVGAGRQSVFGTDLARELQVLLYAIAHPSDEPALRAALATRFFGLDLGALEELLDAPDRWQQHADRFLSWNRQWRTGGVQSVIQSVVAANAAVFTAAANAERLLTDVRHLGELLQAANQDCDGPESLLAWLSAQRSGEQSTDDAAEEQQLRIESDARRVRLMTLHASKGLQFPVVFLPLMWAHEGRKSATPLVHDPRTGGRVLDLGSADFDAAVAEEMYADQDERFRVLYVALTRAQYACHVHAFAPAADKAADPNRAALTALLARLGERLPEGQTLAIGSVHIAWSEDGWAWPRVDYCADPAPVNGARRALAPPPSPPFESRYSFSALALRHVGASVEEAAGDEDVDAYDPLAHADPLANPAASPDRDTSEPVHPDLVALGAIKGADFGNALHAIFEQRRIGRSMSGQHDLVRGCLLDAGVRLGEMPLDVLVPRVATRMQSTLEASLLPDATPALRLSALPAAHLRAEMEFNYLLGEVSLQRLRDACAAHGEPDLVPSGSERVLRGLMNGKIDLVLQHGERFHVLDYKSNFLGERLADYAPAALHAAMDDHDYRFQALLYTVAVDRYLRQRQPGYRRAQHLGEAIYLFVRAVGLAPQAGIWAHRFDDALVDAVDAVLATAARREAA